MSVDYAVSGVPETYFIDPDGIIRVKHVGPISPPTLAQDVKAVSQTARGTPPMSPLPLSLAALLALASPRSRPSPARCRSPAHGREPLPPELEARAQHIGRGLRCAVCQGLSITDSSASTPAPNWRRFATCCARAAATGRSAPTSSPAYGEWVLLEPPGLEQTSCSGWALWLCS